MSTLKQLQQQLAQHFNRLDSRERRAAIFAASVVVLAAVWWLGVAPALGVLRQSGHEKLRLSEQLGHMQAQAARAKSMAAKPAAPPAQAVTALETLAKAKFGAATSFSINSDRILIGFKGASPDAVAQFLLLARTTGSAVVTDAKWTRGVSPAGQTTWDGTLTLKLANPA